MKTISLKHTTNLTRGYLICITGTTIWSTTAIFIRYLTETYHLPALVLAFWRDLFVALSLLAALTLLSPARRRIDRRHLRFIIMFGFVLSLFNGLWTVSVALNGAAVATVMAYSSAAITALLGWRLYGERLSPGKAAAVVISLLGCAVVSGAWDLAAWRLNPLGILTGLLSGVGFAGYSLFGKSTARREIHPWTAMMYTFAVAAGFLLVYNLLSSSLAILPASSGNLFWLDGSLQGWGLLWLLALVPTLGGYGLYTVSLRHLPASVANLIATLEPSMTAILAYLLLHERLSTEQLLGSGLIISGVIILRLTEREPEGAAPVLEPG